MLEMDPATLRSTYMGGESRALCETVAHGGANDSENGTAMRSYLAGAPARPPAGWMVFDVVASLPVDQFMRLFYMLGSQQSPARMLNTRGVSSFNDLNTKNTRVYILLYCILFTHPPYLAS